MNYDDYNLLQNLNEINKTKLGVVVYNDCYLTYSFKLQLNNDWYYINMELANGKYISRIKDLSKAFLYNTNYGLKDYLAMLERAKFSYKIVGYNDINFIYVFNKKYEKQFNIDSNYTDLD